MFTLICYKQTQLGLVKHFYANDGQWYVATNNALEFKSKQGAKSFYMNHNINPIATQVYVQGPRGGVTSMGDIGRVK